MEEKHIKKLNVGLTYYRLDISNQEENKQYKAIVEQAKAQGHKKDTHHYINFSTPNSKDKLVSFYDKIKELAKINNVEIETKHLFNNQFNTTKKSFNLRLWFWSEVIFENKDIKQGYFLTDCTELKKLIHNTFTCGYCGKQYTNEEHKNLSFCDSCLDSEYLEEKQLHLLRLKRLDDNSNRLPLNDCDKEVLTASFISAQINGSSKRGIERIKKKRESLLKSYNKAKLDATIEYKGFIWCLDKGINTSNLIYYNHTKKFCFGWRKPLSTKEDKELMKQLKGFPYDIEVKNDNN